MVDQTLVRLRLNCFVNGGLPFHEIHDRFGKCTGNYYPPPFELCKEVFSGDIEIYALVFHDSLGERI